QIILCLVTPDETPLAAREAAKAIAPGALYCDMTSVSPDTTREAAALIERAGGRYVDVGVMSPVGKFLNKVPMKGSGPHAAAAREALGAYGFELEVVEGDIGQASAIKMVRSVIVKGLEALTTEWLLAAEAVGVTDDVVVSLKGKWPGIDWAEKGDYNLGRMMLHGKRRAAEMDEAVRTLEALGVSARMSAATRDWHRSVGEMALPTPEGLREKLRLVRAGGVSTA
ncbi:MAG: NAD(P)-dependent oxidoreductase, partial [Sphingomonadaceae bacterium]|nr:NAD(P)-dependent oxidoreductase [Sphingomonadaceae bacterium]